MAHRPELNIFFLLVLIIFWGNIPLESQGAKPTSAESLNADLSSEKVLCQWDFSEPAGTPIGNTKNTGQQEERNWQENLQGCFTNGKGSLRIRRNAPEKPNSTFVNLGEQGTSATSLYYLVNISKFRFAGSNKREKVHFGFTANRARTPKITALMTLGRDEKGQIYLSGTALGSGSTKIPRQPILTNTYESGIPLTLILRLNKVVNTYEIFYRLEAQPTKSIGIGRVSAKRKPKFARLKVEYDFGARWEFFDIDMIKITTP